MNYGMIVYMLGWICLFEAMFMALPLMVAVIYQEPAGWAYLMVLVLCAVLGLLLTRRKVKNRKIYGRDGLVIVAFCWIVLSIFGAAPFVISGDIPSFTDALFETISGFTTTGSSILNDVEALSRANLFWRSFTHWIGGMGVLVFILALLPIKAGGAGMYIMRAESPGPRVRKLVPKIKTTAMILYAIYFGMTVLQIILMLLAGTPLFDAMVLSFGSAGTGGFAIKNDGLASYTNLQQAIVTVAMILFGVNFNFYYLLLRRKPRQALACTEVWAYLGIIAASILVITIQVLPRFETVYQAFHHTAFQVSSIITTTGYSTADFNEWNALSKTILVLIMFVGACAGSTGGGIKVSRIIILLKGVRKEVMRVCHPRSIKKVKMDGHSLEHEAVHSVYAFVIIYICIFVVSLLVITLDEKDLVTNFTAVAATINNIGPGLNIVGPAGNFSSFSDLSKFVLMFDMLAGRLELLPLLVLFVPSTWKK
ncbi:MAG: TrkH family potassium uptake protein [Lachnospiraceae bacterium]|jgi:trk system potassium uptake protein TrkH|uniref:TrkH family potassium uptake protein n=1 Tax=Hominisplanchenecus murintestinalis TaxID=2941517 RepID=A0AC61R3T4_9FIRM|nr:TrkH family potassium uptake protein [Hominisplanchenecus murintestinalis]MCI9516390.1 TrkH family potassium uptake protein [Lachnospiraceae bacterium]MCI9660869.1 TrkH family potassium uptake protein [Lachnospiraceae bacterium]TGY00741.1 TrkH family potassium uptake protein [Hominisplanchenecus murintestinalis]